MKVQMEAKCLGLLATREWTEGHALAAMDYIHDIYRLGDSLGINPMSIGQWYRVTIASRATSTLAKLILLNPLPQNDRLILATMAQYDPDIAQGTVRETLDSLAASSYLLELIRGLIIPRDITAVSVLLQGNRSTSSKEQMEILRSLSMWDKEYSYEKSRSLCRKWTTLPAVRRRASLVSDELLRSDDPYLDGIIRQIPRLHYLAARSHVTASWIYNISLSRPYQRVYIAYKARNWHNEHGTWPDEKAFQDAITDSTSLHWHSTHDPAAFMDRYQEMLNPVPRIVYKDDPARAQLETTLPYQISEDGRSATFTYSLPNVKIEYVNPQSQNEEQKKMKLSVSGFPENATVTGESLESWVRGIFSKQPLVESITKAENRKLNIHLRIPETSYWVTHPGPDGIDDGPGLEYDPTNGIVSAGDIVQLAGWE